MVILISTKYYLGVEVFILGLVGVNSDLTGEFTRLTHELSWHKLKFT